jgi:hypothetical protein
MAMSPRQMNCQELIAEELPACLAGDVLAQAVVTEMGDPSQGLVLLRMGGGGKRGIEGVFDGVVIENGGEGVVGTPRDGVCQLMEVACFVMKQDWVMVDNACDEENRKLVAA